MQNPVHVRLRQIGFVSILITLFALLSPVYAVLSPVTGEFQVNTSTGAGATLLDFRDDIGVDPTTGNYIVVWQSDVDLTQSDVYFQRYNSTGVAQGSNTLIHSGNVNDQRRPRIAVNPTNGDFVIVWESDDDATASFNYNVYARKFNASGAALTGEVLVAGAAGAQTDARVAMNASGDFVVTWQSLGDGSSTGIYFQRYNSAGVAQGSATQANVTTTNPQVFPAIGMDSTGNFVIVWRDASVGPAVPNIVLRGFNSAGAAITGEITAGSTANTQSDPVIAMRPTGDFVVVWSSNHAFANAQVYFQRYNSSLTPQGAETLVSTNTGTANDTPDVSMNNSGEFMISWTYTVTAGTNLQIEGRRYSAAGASIGSEFRVDTVNSTVDTGSAVGYANNGYALFSWTSSPNNELYARLFADSADLAISKTSAVTGFPAYANLNYVPGVTLTYTITVTNSGPSAVIGATVTDVLPPELAGATWSCVAAGSASCVSGSPSGTGAAGAGNISQLVDIANGGGNTLTFTLTRAIPTNQLTPINNTASVAAPATTIDTNSFNNSAIRNLTAIEVADMTVAMTDTPDPVTAGRDISYTITVTNTGPSNASTVSLSDTIPTGTTFVSLAAPGGWSCSTPAVGGTGSVSCSISALAAAANGVFTLVVRTNPGTGGTSVSNTATVSSASSATQIDPNGPNNTALASTSVIGPTLVFTQQPTNTNAGASITPAVTVELRDTTNAVITTDNTSQIALAIGTNPGGGTLTGGGAVTVVNGVATFAGLSINNSGVGYTLVASSTGSLNVSSNAFNITAQPATQLTFGTQPTNTVAGAAITPSVTVEIRDASNAIVVGDNTTQVTLAIGTNPGGGTLSGTLTQTAVNGIVTFPGLNIDLVGTGYTLDATSLGLTGDTSTPFDITAAAADHLTFVQQPTDAVAGVAIAPAVTVEIRDAFDNVVNSTATVNLTIGTNPGGGTLSGTVSVAAVAGVATFNTLSIDAAGVGYTLDANSTGLTADTSSAFNITAAAADHVTFVQQPTNTVAGATITPAVTVEIRDAFDNVVNSSATVNLAIGINPGGGTLSGTVSVAAVAGVATFNTLSIDAAGVGYTLDANSTGLTADTSSAFNITAAAADHVTFVQQPTNTVAGATITPAVTVEIRDAFDNVVNSSATVNLAIGINPGGGTLSGTVSVAAVAGVATFNTLSIDNTGIGYTLDASSTGLTGDTSDAFNIIVGTPSQIAFNVQPTNTTAGASITPSVTVEVRDAFNNLVTTDNGTLITLAIGTNPGSGILSGTAAQPTVNGVATFPGLSIDKAGIGYTLVAAAGGYSNVISTAFTITAAAADHLAFLQQPTNTTAGATITPAVTVQILDAFDNVVNSGANITLAIGSNPSGGTLSGTTTQAAVAGLAVFNNLSINNVGTGYTLVASSAGLSNETSTPFNIVVGAPSQIAFNVQPTNTIAGASITPSVTVEVRDASNNLVTTDNGTLITLAIGTNPGAGALSGTATQATVNGIATFPGLSIDKAGIGYTLVASAGGYSNVISTAFNITAAAPDHIAFLQQPTNTVAGASITPAVTVQILDIFDNVVTTSSANVTVAIGTNPGGGTLAGTATIAAVNGVATFSNLSINLVGVGYTLTANTAGLAGITSSAFNITAGAAAQLAFVQQPTDASAGAGITPAMTVQVLDAFGNLVTTSAANITLAIDTNPGGGVLSGTATVAAVNGLATFPGLSIDKVGTGYTLEASSAGLASAVSTAFNITAAAADHLAFLQQPSSTGVNTSIAPAITVQILDAFDNVVTTSSATVTLSILNNPGAGTLSGTVSVAAVNGIATFSNLSINNIGTGYTLNAASSGLTSAVSTAFDITAAAAAQLVFVQQPTNTTAGASITPAVTVEVRDAFGNTVVSDNSTQITLAIGTNPGAGTLGGTVTVTVVNGVAAFSNVNIDKVGTGYTLTAAAAGLTGATSTTFDITAAAAAQLAFVQQPVNTAIGATITPAVTVEIRDAFDNLVATSGTSITLAIGTNPGAGTLGGTLSQLTVNGVATFPDLTIDQVGVGYTLDASAAGLTGATSTAFNITAGAPSQIAFNVQPTTTNIGVNITPAVTVEVRDALNNVVTTDNSTQITLAIGANPGGGTLGGTLTQTVVNGVAAFSNLTINQIGSGYTLVASSSGYSSVTSNPFDITSLPPTQLAFAQQPTNTLLNAVITPPVTVELRNALNVLVANDNTTQVTIAIDSNPGVGALGGTLTVTAVNGIATFNDLTIDQLGVGYTLTVSAPGLTGATSGTFNIFTVPNDTIVGVVYNDLNGNGTQDPGDANMIGVTVFLDTNNDGVLSGGEQNTLTDTNGTYSFIGLAAGSYNVRILPSAGFAITTPQPVVVIVPQTAIASVNIGQRSVTQPTSIAPTAAPTIVIGDPLITKQVDPPFAIPGEAVTWVITVTNPGTLAAANITVTDNVPSVVQIDTVNATAGSIGFSGQLVTFTMASLPPGVTVTITINGHVRTDAQLPFVVTNTATLTSGENGSARSASAVLTGVSDLPHTGEGMADWQRLMLVIVGVGAVLFVAIGAVSKLNLKR